MKTDISAIDPRKRYKWSSSDSVFTGQQVLNVLKLATLVMRTIILSSDLRETDEPVNRQGRYGRIPLN